jgi:drug/metabolite transporter (DMT)-like permease
MDLGWLVLSALSGYGIYQLLYIEGLSRTTPFASSLFLATVPLWSAVLVALFRVERTSALQWVGVVISLAGVAWFLFAGGAHASEFRADHALSASDIILGGALSLGAAVLFALYGVVNKRLVKRYTPTELMCYTLLIGTLALAPFGAAALAQQDWSHVTWRLWVILPFSVAFPIYITYSIWNWAIGVRGVGYVTIYNYAVPIVAGLVAWKAFGEGLNGIQLVSAALTLAGMLLARWAISRSRRAHLAVSATRPWPDSEPAVARELTD